MYLEYERGEKETVTLEEREWSNEVIGRTTDLLYEYLMSTASERLLTGCSSIVGLNRKRHILGGIGRQAVILTLNGLDNHKRDNENDPQQGLAI